MTAEKLGVLITRWAAALFGVLIVLVTAGKLSLFAIILAAPFFLVARSPRKFGPAVGGIIVLITAFLAAFDQDNGVGFFPLRIIFVLPFFALSLVFAFPPVAESFARFALFVAPGRGESPTVWLQRMWEPLSRLFLSWPMRVVYAYFVTLVASILYLYCLISFIGIPLAILLAFVPAAAALYVTAGPLHDYVFRRLTGGRMAIAASLAIPVAAAIFVAQSANAVLDRRMDALIAGDRDQVGEGPIRTLGIVSDSPSAYDAVSPCDEMCVRALLSGQVDEVLVAQVKTPIDALDPEMRVIAVRLVQATNRCPAKRIAGGVARAERVARNAEERARLRISGEDSARLRQVAAECLSERPARLKEADAVLVSTQPAKGIVLHARAGLDAYADTVRAKRLSLFRAESGAFREVYRRTLVWSERHPPIAIPAIVHGYGLETAVGFFRIGRRVNAERYEDAPDAVAFLHDRLGFDFSLAETPAPDMTASQ